MPDTHIPDGERSSENDGPHSQAAQTSASSSPDAQDAGAPTAAADDAAREPRSDDGAATVGDEPENSDPRDAFQRLVDVIISCTESPPLWSEKWDFLSTHDNWLRIEMPPSEFVAALEQDYSADVLVGLGIYERVDDQLRLPSWLDGDAPFYVSIDEHSGITFSGSHEFLFPMTRTALDYALEQIPSDSPQTTDALFVVESLDAVDILRRLRLRAVACEGLEAAGRDDILRLFRGDQRSDSSWRYYLVFVDCDVPLLKNHPTAALGEVIARLTDAADVYSIDPGRRFGVCRPSAQEFQIFERAISFQDSVQIEKIFERWAAAAQRERIASWRTRFATKPTSFSVARPALVRALKLPNDIARFEVPAALANYRIAGQSSVIEKFCAAVDRASEAFDQFQMTAAVRYAETFFDNDPLVLAAEAVMAGRTPPSAAELAEAFQQQQRCLLELRRIQSDRRPKR